MSDTQLLNLLSLVANLLIVSLTILSLVVLFCKRFNQKLEIKGVTSLIFFTIQSNILVAISSVVMIVYNIINLANNSNDYSRFALVFKYVSTIAVMVTFMTVMLFLGPTQGYIKMLKGINLPLHLITPLLAIISFVFFERNGLFFYETLFALIPVILYEIVYTIMVLFAKKWKDFYGFTTNNLTLLFIIGFPIITYGYACLIYYLHNLFI